MATTLSLVVIFVPVAFMTGQIGRYFYSFGITSAAAILLSMFVSFTLTPALCAWWLKPEDVKSDHSTTKSSGFYARMDRGLRRDARLVDASPADDDRHRRRRHRVGRRSSIPTSARNSCPTTTRASSTSTSGCRAAPAIQRTEEYVQPIEKEIIALPALRRVRVQVNPGSASFGVTMVDLEERKISQQELMIRTRAMLRKYQGARISVSGGTDISGASTSGPGGGRGGGPGGGGGSSNRLSILIQGPDIEQLQDYTVQLMDKLRTIRGVVDVDSNFEPTQPELRITVDRARAADLGVNIDTLANNLRIAGRRRRSVGVQGRRRSVHRPPAARRTVPEQSARRWATCWCRPGRPDGKNGSRERCGRADRTTAARPRSTATTASGRSR